MQHDMLLIQALDPVARLRFTNMSVMTPNNLAWVVEADIRITEGDSEVTVVEHQATPWEALQAYRMRLQEVTHPDTIVTRHYGEERRYIWNGAAWREVSP
jgi:hypothetical protein